MQEMVQHNAAFPTLPSSHEKLIFAQHSEINESPYSWRQSPTQGPYPRYITPTTVWGNSEGVLYSLVSDLHSVLAQRLARLSRFSKCQVRSSHRLVLVPRGTTLILPFTGESKLRTQSLSSALVWGKGMSSSVCELEPGPTHLKCDMFHVGQIILIFRDWIHLGKQHKENNKSDRSLHLFWDKIQSQSRLGIDHSYVVKTKKYYTAIPKTELQSILRNGTSVSMCRSSPTISAPQESLIQMYEHQPTY